MGTGGQQHRVKFFLELHQADIAANVGIVDDLNPHGADNINIALKNMARHPVGGNADRDHAAAETFRQGLIDSAGITFQRQIVGRRKPGRTGTDDGNLFTFAWFGLHRRLMVMFPFIISSGALEHHDIDRTIDIGTPTGRFTRVGADAPAHGRQWHAFTNHLKCLAKLPILDGFDVSRNIDMSRALVLTGRRQLHLIVNGRRLARSTLDVSEIVLTEVLDRINDRNRRARAQGAFTVLQQLGYLLNRFKIPLLPFSRNNARQGILHYTGPFFAGRTFGTAEFFLHPGSIFGCHGDHINTRVIENQTIPPHKGSDFLVTIKGNRKFLFGDRHFSVAALAIINNLSSPAGKCNFRQTGLL